MRYAHWMSSARRPGRPPTLRRSHWKRAAAARWRSRQLGTRLRAPLDLKSSIITSSPPRAGILSSLVLRRSAGRVRGGGAGRKPLVAAVVRRPRARDWGRVARSRSLPFVGTAVAQTSTVVAAKQFDSSPPPPPPADGSAYMARATVAVRCKRRFSRPGVFEAGWSDRYASPVRRGSDGFASSTRTREPIRAPI